jgi:hypothetical protein
MDEDGIGWAGSQREGKNRKQKLRKLVRKHPEVTGL